MRRILSVIVGVSALSAPATADIPTAPRPTWGTPAPRSTPTPSGRQPTPLPAVDVWTLAAREGSSDELRDVDVSMRAERVSVTFLRNLVWVRSTVIVRAETAVAAWPMGMTQTQRRTRGQPVFGLEVRAGGEQVAVRRRSVPIEGDAIEPRPGRDEWLEWRIDLPAGRDTRVDVAYVVPAQWSLADDEGAPTFGTENAPHGYVQWFEYDLAPGRRYRDGRARTTVSARTAGYSARIRRMRARGDPEDLGQGASFHPGAGEGRVRLELAWLEVDPPSRAAHLADIPAWIELLDRWTFAFPFTPTAQRPIAPHCRAEDFARMASELREIAEQRRGSERDVARGLLAALRVRLAGASGAEPADLEDEAGLPRARQLGMFGGALDDGAWREAIEDARRWLLPRGEPLEPLEPLEWAEPAGKRPRRPDAAHRARASADTLLAMLDAPADAPVVVEHDEVARQLAERIGPPFGRPNQLVLASQRRAGSPLWEWLAIAGALAIAALLVARRVRAKRSR